MRIGQLARASGVTPDTIRYYEKIGLMPPVRRTDAGYREYPTGAPNRIRVIRNAVQLGFPLKEIARVLRIRNSGGAPCQQVRDYARQLIDDLEHRIEELKAERIAMLKMVQEWDAMLSEALPGTVVRLLERNTIASRRPIPKQARLRRGPVSQA